MENFLTKLWRHSRQWLLLIKVKLYTRTTCPSTCFGGIMGWEEAGWEEVKNDGWWVNNNKWHDVYYASVAGRGSTVAGEFPWKSHSRPGIFSSLSILEGWFSRIFFDIRPRPLSKTLLLRQPLLTLISSRLNNFLKQTDRRTDTILKLEPCLWRAKEIMENLGQLLSIEKSSDWYLTFIIFILFLSFIFSSHFTCFFT